MAAITGLVAVAGCATNGETPDPPVGQAQFERRISALEQRILRAQERERAQIAENRKMLSERAAGLAEDLRSRLAKLDGSVSRQTVLMRRVLTHLESIGKAAKRETGPGTSRQVESKSEKLPQQSITFGREEWAGFPTLGLALQARIDSGAETSSLSAKEIQEFEREGEDWVRFRLALSEKEHEFPERARGRLIEAPVIRRVRIIQASGTDSRPVIRLPVQVGPVTQRTQFTLENRTNLSYPLLLGRRFMMDIAVIDVSRKYLQGRPEYSESSQPREGGSGARAEP
ncbi:ATP-dependent zinc protease [Thiohalorhabdus methylotrophus]|uniref:ATP-dependent zinc protease family protein n=1 Tax=Thiohalorhabdus methylotrophus TaxID=3242694 RepID=UPI0035A0F099